MTFVDRWRSKSAVVPALSFALSIGVAAVAVADDATASGRWTVEGQTVELKFARTFREPDPFGGGTSPCVLVSNEAVPDAAVPDDDEGVSELLDLMREGTMRALQVCFEPSGTRLRNVNDVMTFHPGVSPGRFGLQGYHQFTAKPAAGRIAGSLTGKGETQSGGSWSDEIEISAPMP